MCATHGSQVITRHWAHTGTMNTTCLLTLGSALSPSADRQSPRLELREAATRQQPAFTIPPGDGWPLAEEKQRRLSVLLEKRVSL